MHRALLFCVLLLAAMGPTACGSSASTQVTAPSTSRCQATVTNSSSSFAPTGGTGSVTIIMARECSWSAATDAGWITFITPVDGQGDGTVGYRVAQNGDPSARQAAISVADLRVTVAQQPAPCEYQVSAASSALAPTGGTFVVTVRTNPACAWTASSEATWATVAPEGGQGDGSVAVTVPANSGASRTISLLIAGTRVVATQAAAGAPAPTPSPEPPAPTPAPTPVPVPVPVNFTDHINSLTGECPSLTMSIGSYVVYTTTDTNYKKVACDKLERNMRVKVTGFIMPDGRVRADEVEKK